MVSFRIAYSSERNHSAFCTLLVRGVSTAVLAHGGDARVQRGARNAKRTALAPIRNTKALSFRRPLNERASSKDNRKGICFSLQSSSNLGW